MILMVDEYELDELILSALESPGCPVSFDDDSKLKIMNICKEFMYSKNRDEFKKEIESIVKTAVVNKLLTE